MNRFSPTRTCGNHVLHALLQSCHGWGVGGCCAFKSLAGLGHVLTSFRSLGRLCGLCAVLHIQLWHLFGSELQVSLPVHLDVVKSVSCTHVLMALESDRNNIS